MRQMNKTRILPLLTLAFCLGSSSAQAQWTGISVEIGESSSDLEFETEQRTMRVDSLSLQIEEKTATDLRVGFSIGLTSIRSTNILPPDNGQKFEGNQLGFYLRLPLQLGEYFSLEGLYSYRYNTATDSSISSPSEIEWHDNRLKIGLGTKLQTLRFTAFLVYRSMSGDISNNTSVELFDSIDKISRGISFDYFVESTAFIRLQLSRGAEDIAYLNLVRVY
jgi:hypothetical protein